ncbi:MAG: hypothetical protein Q8N17_00275 [Burkholderiaceae bacterium]|nr:hypothetical protein [Burkholderiaceae bacterium]
MYSYPLSGAGSLSAPVSTSQSGTISPAGTALELALHDLQEISGVAAPLIAPNSDTQWLDPKTTDPLKHFTGQLYDAVQQTPAVRDIVIARLQTLSEVLENQAQSASDMNESDVAKQIDIVKLHVEGTISYLQDDAA